jgi:beta-carotene 3-hydroxylase
MLLNISLMLATFLFMEGFAWFTHKYIMHGLMWRWHESHHTPHKSWWEKNDLFSVLFGVAATATIVVGSEVPSLRPLMWIGFGITLYGISYFIFHDILVHRRVKIRYTPRSRYMKRIMKAHFIHHKVHVRDGAEAFGFLYAPRKYEHQSLRKATKGGNPAAAEAVAGMEKGK